MPRTVLLRLHSYRHSCVTAILVVLLVLAVFPSRLHGSEIILHRFDSEEPDPGLEDVLFLSAGVRLMQAGFSSSRDDPGPRYVLLASYRWRAGGRILLRYTLTDPGEYGRVRSELELEFPLDHDLDDRISAAIDRLFDEAEISPVASPEADIIGLLSESSSLRSGAEAVDARQQSTEEPTRTSELTSVPASGPASDSVPVGTGIPAFEPADTIVLSEPAAPRLEPESTESGQPESEQSEPVLHSLGLPDTEPREPVFQEPRLPVPGPKEPEPQEPEPQESRSRPQEPELLEPESRLPEQQPGAAGDDRTSDARTPVILRFDASVSASGTVLFGRITGFFHYGVGGRLSAGVEWLHGFWSLSLGAAVSVVRAFNDPGVTGGTLYLSTAGPNVELGTGASVPYRITVGVSGGPSFITVARDTGTLTKTVPYAELGVHSILPLGTRLSLGGGVRITAVFDPELVIIGAAPSFTARMWGRNGNGVGK